MARHATASPPPVRAARPSVPLPVDAAVRRALAKLPADRFATANKFAEALGAAEIQRRPRRQAMLRPLAIGAGLLAMGIIGAVLLRRSPVETGSATVGVLVVPTPLQDSSGKSQLPARSAQSLLSGAIDWLPGVHVIDGLSLADSVSRLSAGSCSRVPGNRVLATCSRAPSRQRAMAESRRSTCTRPARASGSSAVRLRCPAMGSLPPWGRPPWQQRGDSPRRRA